MAELSLVAHDGRHFAQYLSDDGAAVLTFDYRDRRLPPHRTAEPFPDVGATVGRSEAKANREVAAAKQLVKSYTDGVIASVRPPES